MENDCSYDCYIYLISLINNINKLDIIDQRTLENVKSDVSDCFSFSVSIGHIYVRLRLLLGKKYDEQYNIIMQLITYAFGKKYIYM